MMRGWRGLIGAVLAAAAAIFALGGCRCASLIPGAPAPYVGTWRSEYSVLRLDADGTGVEKRDTFEGEEDSPVRYHAQGADALYFDTATAGGRPGLREVHVTDDGERMTISDSVGGYTRVR